eukprot:1765859-Karenia_brevis.AAC.1
MSQQQSFSSRYVCAPAPKGRKRKEGEEGGEEERRERWRTPERSVRQQSCIYVKISSKLNVTMPGRDQDCMSM